MIYFIGCFALLFLAIVLGVRRGRLMGQTELKIWVVVVCSLSAITFAVFALMVIDAIR
jgi:hypothetical protein